MSQRLKPIMNVYENNHRKKVQNYVILLSSQEIRFKRKRHKKGGKIASSLLPRYKSRYVYEG